MGGLLKSSRWLFNTILRPKGENFPTTRSLGRGDSLFQIGGEVYDVYFGPFASPPS